MAGLGGLARSSPFASWPIILDHDVVLRLCGLPEDDLARILTRMLWAYCHGTGDGEGVATDEDQRSKGSPRAWTDNGWPWPVGSFESFTKGPTQCMTLELMSAVSQERGADVAVAVLERVANDIPASSPSVAPGSDAEDTKEKARHESAEAREKAKQARAPTTAGDDDSDVKAREDGYQGDGGVKRPADDDTISKAKELTLKKAKTDGNAFRFVKKNVYLGHCADEEDAARAVAEYVERGVVAPPGRGGVTSEHRGVSWEIAEYVERGIGECLEHGTNPRPTRGSSSGRNTDPVAHRFDETSDRGAGGTPALDGLPGGDDLVGGSDVDGEGELEGTTRETRRDPRVWAATAPAKASEESPVSVDAVGWKGEEASSRRALEMLQSLGFRVVVGAWSYAEEFGLDITRAER